MGTFSSLKNLLGIKELNKYGPEANSYDMAKFMAITFMVIDHIGSFFLIHDEILRALGRLAFPLFFFLIGYSKDYRTQWNLLILGLTISVFKALMINQPIPVDILISAFITKLVMNKMNKQHLMSYTGAICYMILLIVWHIIFYSVMQYGMVCVMFAICGYLKREAQTEKEISITHWFILFTIVFDYFFQNIIFKDSGPLFQPVFFAVSIALTYILVNFRINQVFIQDKAFKKLVLFLSRNSLFVYFSHFMLFVYLSGKLFPEFYIR